MADVYYVVKIGITPGIYKSKEDFLEQTKRVTGWEGRKFKSLEEAENYFNATENISKAASRKKKKEKKIKHPSKDRLSSDEVIAYVDGSYCSANRYPSYGVVFITSDEEFCISGRVKSKDAARIKSTAGELEGAKKAMEFAFLKGYKKLTIYHDFTGISQFCNCNPRTKNTSGREYKEKYESVKDNLEVNFIHVKSHSGDEYNEKADRLARMAI